jgi:hypothetical protein
MTTLEVRCRLLPAYVSFMKDNMLAQLSEGGEEAMELRDKLPKFLQDIMNLWVSLGLDNSFREYVIDGEELYMELFDKKAWSDNTMMAFVKEILVPMTSEILECRTIDDLYDRVRHYSDSELRNVSFCLEDQVRSLKHVYSEDGSEIYETHVVYKRSIPRRLFLDLDRAYGYGR